MNHPGTDTALGGARLSAIKASMTGLNPDGRRPDAERRIKKSSEKFCGNNYSETKMRLVLTFIRWVMDMWFIISIQILLDDLVSWYNWCIKIFDFLHIPSCAVTTWSNIISYCIHHCSDWWRMLIRLWTHKRHPIPQPHRWAMWCLYWRKLTAL